MNQPTQQVTPAAESGLAQAPATAPEESYEERVARVFADDEGSDAQPAADAGTAATPPPAGATAGSAPAPSADEERRARLAALEAEERNRVDAQAKHREADEIRKRLAAAEERVKEAEERAKTLVDPSSLNEESFFEMARKLNVTPQKLGEFLREQMANPELAAARAATREIDPKFSALEKRIAEQDAQIQSFLQQQAQASAQAEEQRAAQEFYSFVGQSEATAPRSAAFLTKFGGDEFYKLAISASASLPAGAGPQAVLDKIEDNLAMLAPIYAPPSATQQRQAPPPNPAAAKAMTTVSNTLAAQRATVVDEDAEWASLPFEERSARLFR